MGLLYLTTDEGDCFSFDDGSGKKVYQKVSPGFAVPNGDAADIVDATIPTFTFSVADLQGKTVYTRGEHGVAFYLPQNMSSVVKTASSTELFTLMTEAPVSGVLRIYLLGETMSDGQVYVNGALVWNNGTMYSKDGFAWGAPFNVLIGDKIEVKSTNASVGERTIYGGILPFNWPI